MAASVYFAVSDRRGKVRVRTSSARYARLRARFLRDAQILPLQRCASWSR